jgi:hypothetical protein
MSGWAKVKKKNIVNIIMKNYRRLPKGEVRVDRKR